MAQPHRETGISLSALWRNPDVRAVLYQILILGSVALAGYTIFQNTLHNLEQRGISSGFSFLGNEAGFGISEVVSIPQMEGGMVHLLLAIVAGLAFVFLLSRWRQRQGRTISEDTRLVSLVVAVLVFLPIAVLYISGDTIRTEVYTEASSYGTAMVTGLFNTFKVALVGCVLATMLGLLIGISRLSSNWLISKLAETYIEILRNIPLLVQLFFWYVAVLRTMPHPRQSLRIFDLLILNNRGLYLPGPVGNAHPDLFMLSIVLVLVGSFFYARYVNRRRDETGEQLPFFWPLLGALIVVPGLVWLIVGQPFTLDFPELKGFNFRGGLELSPEFAALLIGLTMYTAAFIAEIVRSGIQAISKGQREAAQALGFRGGQTMRLIILPQALRVMIPPLTSQYLNLTKNSSLGVAIGYMEVVSVGGTTINQSGQAIEVIALTMMVYLIFSLSISMFMNWYNAKMRLVER